MSFVENIPPPLRSYWSLAGMLFAGFLFAVLSAAYFSLSAPSWSAEVDRFVIPAGAEESEVIARLRTEGYIRSTRAFDAVLSLRGWHGKIMSGGYRLSKSMSAWRIASTLAHEPYMRWVSIPEGLRKEEIAEILKRKLDWDETEVVAFLNPPPSIPFPLPEGYYFPDTYLVSVDENGAAVAGRMLDRFNERFAPLYTQFLEQNIKHTTAVKLASILEREAAGPDDMPIVAGILWNRLDMGMKLDIDATLQYARGKTERGWWSPVSKSDKAIESPFNTYRNAGLPPTPISNPGMSALEAALHPAETQCIFYLHDSERKIRCAKTYAEHLKNIEKYLR